LKNQQLILTKIKKSNLKDVFIYNDINYGMFVNRGVCENKNDNNILNLTKIKKKVDNDFKEKMLEENLDNPNYNIIKNTIFVVDDDTDEDKYESSSNSSDNFSDEDYNSKYDSVYIPGRYEYNSD